MPRTIIALYCLCVALALAGMATHGPEIVGGIDVIEERIAAPPLTR